MNRSWVHLWHTYQSLIYKIVPSANEKTPQQESVLLTFLSIFGSLCCRPCDAIFNSPVYFVTLPCQTQESGAHLSSLLALAKRMGVHPSFFVNNTHMSEGKYISTFHLNNHVKNTWQLSLVEFAHVEDPCFICPIKTVAIMPCEILNLNFTSTGSGEGVVRVIVVCVPVVIYPEIRQTGA